MQGVKYKYSVDALKVCYSIKNETYSKLTENPEVSKNFIFQSPNYQNILTEDFRLERVKNKSREFNILVPDENGNGNLVPYGYLRIKADNDEDFAGKCFITLDNRRLYEPFTVYHEVIEFKKPVEVVDIQSLNNISEYVRVSVARTPKTTTRTQYNTIFFLEEMASRLSLELVSISNLEIALDSNINFARLIKRNVANSELIPVINNTKFPDIESRQRLNNTHITHSTTRLRAVNLGYLIKQSNNELQLKCYNKVEEIEAESKQKTYIYRWLGMDKNIHRMEITAKWSPIKAFCKNNDLTVEDFLYNLHTGEILSEPFIIWLNRLIHFKTVGKSKGTISVFDLVTIKSNKKQQI